MSYIFVLDSTGRALDPIHPGAARLLLTLGQAAVFRRFPFTLILKRAEPETTLTPLRLKIDPGSQITGLAVVNDASGQVVWAAELTHRGKQISRALAARQLLRRARRQRKTRYRPARSANRHFPKGWLPPSQHSRVHNIETWVARLRRACPIRALSLELVKFDTQLLENPYINGIEYQQGTPTGYELREYLLEQWGRRCAYCHAEQVPLEVEHIVPRSRGGTNRRSNLVVACRACNGAKGTQTAAEFGHPEVQAQAKRPLKDAAVVNSTRWALYQRLQATGLPVEVGTGGRTKYNRCLRGLPKTHWLDAACVGVSTPEALRITGVVPLYITAQGWQSRQMCRMDRYGFPRTGAKQHSRIRGFRTGDMVRAVVTRGKKVGTYVGRVAVRANGSFNITADGGAKETLSATFCRIIQQRDGYAYAHGQRSVRTPL